MLIVVERSHTLTPAGSISNKDITPAGTIGGHTLSVAELATHSHNWRGFYACGDGKKTVRSQLWISGDPLDTGSNAGSSHAHSHTFTGTKNTHNHTFAGTQVTINHMNPYLVAYCYKRIS